MRKILVLAGPSAVGKTTVVKELLTQNPKFEYIRSATTRAPRGDGHDSEYIYLTECEFRKRIADGGMLEYTEYCGNYYGTLSDKVIDRLESKNVVLEIEVEGAMNVKKKFPDAVVWCRGIIKSEKLL